MATKSFRIFKLYFTSPLHIGDSHDDYSVSQRIICSDTMYAALTSCLAKVGNPMPADGDLGCTISSLFPFYQASDTNQSVLFFPKPLCQNNFQLKDVSKAKLVKRVSWLDKSFFEKVINGETLFDNESDMDSIHGTYLSSSEMNGDFIHSHTNQRVTISRSFNEDAKPFFMDRVLFSECSGLYFLFEGDCKLLRLALNVLQEEGIGTDRNVGNGFFRYEEDSLELKLPDYADAQVSLSVYIPESIEQYRSMIDSPRAAYELLRRGGWITTPPNTTLRKNVIYAFSAGSVFANDNNRCNKGAIVDLRPETPQVEHAVWRCGRALFIPIK